MEIVPKRTRPNSRGILPHKYVILEWFRLPCDDAPEPLNNYSMDGARAYILFGICGREKKMFKRETMKKPCFFPLFGSKKKIGKK